MRKKIILIAFAFITIIQGFAQQTTDEEMNRLINIVSTLRQGKETAWNNALDAFRNDNAWTMMDEIERDDNESWLIGDKHFKLNPILNQCSGRTGKMLPGDFLNGNDPNFNYSLTERGIKKGCTVSYEMKYREGKQCFVVIPYDIAKAKQLEFEVFLNDNSVGKSRHGAEGNLYLEINQNVVSSDTLKLVITNHSDTDMPVVIINHNTRKL